MEYSNLLKDDKRFTPEMVESRAYYEGDLWRDGKGLAVKKPTATDKLAEVKDGFATQNVVEEIIDRKCGGI